MDLLSLYVALIRISLVILAGYHILKRDGKKVVKAAIAFALTFLSLLSGILHLQLNGITSFLFPTVVFMATYWGSGWKFYDRFSWWDRLIHCLSGILFFGLGVSLAQKVPNAGLSAILVFSFAFSLAIHLLWEVLEYLADCFTHSDNQRWQTRSQDTIHLPKGSIQPPGLVDTMNDMIFCIIGTTIACIGWWITLS